MAKVIAVENMAWLQTNGIATTRPPMLADRMRLTLQETMGKVMDHPSLMRLETGRGLGASGTLEDLVSMKLWKNWRC